MSDDAIGVVACVVGLSRELCGLDAVGSGGKRRVLHFGGPLDGGWYDQYESDWDPRPGWTIEFIDASAPPPDVYMRKNFKPTGADPDRSVGLALVFVGVVPDKVAALALCRQVGAVRR